MYLKRTIEDDIINSINNSNDIIVIYGARQVGKTTMINEILKNVNLKILNITAEELKYTSIFSSRDLKTMSDFVEGYDILFIDEAQIIDEIGLNIKILHDAIPDLKIILSGSSSFDLSNRIKEPLTGRTKTFMLFPMGLSELSYSYNTYELRNITDELLVIGSYPKLFSLNSRKGKIDHLMELSSSYLYKDILVFYNLKHYRKLYDLLRLLSFQIGNLISIHELANNLKLSSETVEKYIDLLEKSFVVFRLSGFSRNLRKEIKKQDKIFYYDLGVRNAIINNFATIENRDDIGQLWQNFLIVERIKYNKYKRNNSNSYFWRTYTGAEIDYIEETSKGQLNGYEFKWGNKKPRTPKTWLESYPNSSFQLVNKENYLDFII